jgi:hypothetical protein
MVRLFRLVVWATSHVEPDVIFFLGPHPAKDAISIIDTPMTAGL